MCNKEAEDLHVVLMLQNHSILVHLVYVKLGGVPDNICVFPADER